MADPIPLDYIAAALRPLAVPVKDVGFDPANVRRHPDRNIKAITASLRVYGQRKPIVVNRATRTVEAGNGTLAAALDLGWSHIAVVEVDDDPTTAVGFGIADNRTAELAEWDQSALDALLETIEEDDADLQAMFDEMKSENFGEDADTNEQDAAAPAPAAEKPLATCPHCGHEF